jgi:hypothetical protein
LAKDGSTYIGFDKYWIKWSEETKPTLANLKASSHFAFFSNTLKNELAENLLEEYPLDTAIDALDVVAIPKLQVGIGISSPIYPILSYPILSYPILSYPILSLIFRFF